MVSKLFIIAHLPEALEQKFLQHIRDFDVSNPDCVFEIGIEPASDIPLVEAVQRLQVEPNLTFTAIYERTTRDQIQRDDNEGVRQDAGPNEKATDI